MSLALKFRPKNLDEFFGQNDIKDVFQKFVIKKKIPHSIFFGPAGSGKTTLARVIANELEYEFYELDGSNLKVEDIRKILSSHENTLFKALIFIDEIHRLSKNQQETLLIPMENEKAIIMGATTENPQFVLSSGIRSRCMIFEFFPLNKSDLEEILNIIKNKLKFYIDKESKDYLINSSGGDVRSLLNLLEFALLIDESSISLKTLETLRAKNLTQGVSSSDTHYALISAFIKSLRGSDENAAIYYLARLLDAGENVEFIARRMVIFASEDISNANPSALNLAVNSMLAVAKIGMPEARIILSQCVIYLAKSPKSNASYKAINEAMNFVKNNRPLEIPKYLINSDKEKANYLYPHDFSGWVEQKYLSKNLKFYENSDIGFEKTLNEWQKRLKNIH